MSKNLDNSQLTLVQKFDEVLKALYEISGNRPSFGRIEAFIRARHKNVHWGEVLDIFEKMRRDNLLHPEVTVPTSKRPNEIIHLITFEGKLMHERGGLKWKLLREVFTRSWAITISILTLLIAGLSFYFSLFAVKDSSVNKLRDSIIQELSKQDSMLLLNKNNIKTIPDTTTFLFSKIVSKRKK